MLRVIAFQKRIEFRKRQRLRIGWWMRDGDLLCGIDVNDDSRRIPRIAPEPNRDNAAIGAPHNLLAAPQLVTNLEQQTRRVTLPQRRARHLVRHAHLIADQQDVKALVWRVKPLDIAHRNLADISPDALGE
jgi:hypothetical protein